MDYIGNKCPVCQKYFHADEDIVVCPDCGTPHHRECYEQLGHCFNAELHEQGYDYNQDNPSDDEQNNRCKKCGNENEPDAFFCNKCGAPLGSGAQNASQQKTENADQAPFGAGAGAGAYGMPFMDPLGGVPGDTDFGDGISAGETAKYVKQNTPYFIRVFSNIKNFNKSKFNFAAALFRGGYMLYRKMYLPGAIITAIQLAMTIASTYFSVFGYKYISEEFSTLYNQAIRNYNISDMMNALSHANSTDLLFVYIPLIILVVNLVMMIVIGIIFNKMYMNHCKKQIVLIKEKAKESGENPETVLQTKGGVNLGLAISLLITSILISYLPNIIVGLM